jgi:hypothetical protein
LLNQVPGCTAHTSRDTASKADVDDSEMLIQHLLNRLAELNRLAAWIPGSTVTPAATGLAEHLGRSITNGGQDPNR